MSQINSITGATPIQSAAAVSSTSKAAAPSQPQTLADRLELSGASHLLATLQTNDIRVDKVSSIRQQLDAGTYDTDGSKLDSAIDKLMNELNS